MFTLLQSAYENFWIGFVKTSVMMIGELDFGDNFVDGELNNVAASYILFICFVVIMTILVMNLLVGLAVDDIKEIQDKARLKRLQMQVSKYSCRYRLLSPRGDFVIPHVRPSVCPSVMSHHCS